MKRNKILYAMLVGTPFILTACNESTNIKNVDSEVVTEEKKVDSDKALVNAITNLKSGFDAVINFKGTFIENGQFYQYALPLEMLYKNNENERLIAQRELDYDKNGEVVDNDSKFVYYGGDESGLLFAKTLNYKNEVINSYVTSNGSYFNSLYYNPFEMLNESNLKSLGDGQYEINEGFGRQVASWLGVNLDSYFTDRTYAATLLTLENGEFKSFELKYLPKSYTKGLNLNCNLKFDFKKTGNFDYEGLATLDDDGTDKTKLKEALDLISETNYTLDLKVTPGELNMLTGTGYKFYFAGDDIFVDLDTFYTVSGLTNGDVLLTLPNGSKDANFYVKTYSENDNKFITSDDVAQGFKISFNELVAKYNDISLNFFTTEDNGTTYKTRDGYAKSVFNALLPSIVKSDYWAVNATDIQVSFQSDGAPIFTLKFFYSMSNDDFGEIATITLKFSNVGTTTLPEEVKNVL